MPVVSAKPPEQVVSEKDNSGNLDLESVTGTHPATTVVPCKISLEGSHVASLLSLGKTDPYSIDRSLQDENALAILRNSSRSANGVMSLGMMGDCWDQAGPNRMIAWKTRQERKVDLVTCWIAKHPNRQDLANSLMDQAYACCVKADDVFGDNYDMIIGQEVLNGKMLAAKRRNRGISDKESLEQILESRWGENWKISRQNTLPEASALVAASLEKDPITTGRAILRTYQVAVDVAIAGSIAAAETRLAATERSLQGSVHDDWDDSDGSGLENRDNGLAESQDGPGLDDAESQDDSSLDNRSGKSEQHCGLGGHGARTNQHDKEMDVETLVDADVDVDMENMEQTTIPIPMPTLWPNTTTGMISRGKRFSGSLAMAMDVKKEWQSQYCQASLDYAMKQNPIKQLDLGKSLAAIHRDRTAGFTDVTKRLEKQDYTIITVPKTWNDLIKGAKTVPFQRSDTRPCDEVWAQMLDGWDKSAATLPLHEGTVLLETSNHKPLGFKISGIMTTNHDRARNQLLSLHDQEKIPDPKGCDNRHSNLKAARAKYGSDAGVLHLAYWIATGQARRGPVVSSDNLKGCYANRTIRTFHDELRPFLQFISNLFKILDPKQYSHHRQQMDRLAGTQADLTTYLQELPCPFLGMALVWNLQVTPHVDEGDAKHGYVCITNTGTHDNCHLVLGTVDQQYKLAYDPGFASVPLRLHQRYDSGMSSRSRQPRRFSPSSQLCRHEGLVCILRQHREALKRCGSDAWRWVGATTLRSGSQTIISSFAGWNKALAYNWKGLWEREVVLAPRAEVPEIVEEPKPESPEDDPTDPSIKEVPFEETPSKATRSQTARIYESSAPVQDIKRETVGEAGEEPGSDDDDDPEEEDTDDDNGSEIDLDCPDDSDSDMDPQDLKDAQPSKNEDFRLV
ncbi:hypothetical protein HD553DRAFT_322456 [Filobasidium floriforme]|uniref:uncharacterized protein n=1 Tax=Filobasidium floriforme TaxID=5210 RepID=UPI001E8CA546|nr:uncharacterized protein HD553DRAFT_322456 [Filobasidium floriforme]KAH8087892.1 hypothetical protein HD553DRAFT_322456 [Filobasidium floriforme]